MYVYIYICIEICIYIYTIQIIYKYKYIYIYIDTAIGISYTHCIILVRRFFPRNKLAQLRQREALETRRRVSNLWISTGKGQFDQQQKSTTFGQRGWLDA